MKQPICTLIAAILSIACLIPAFGASADLTPIQTFTGAEFAPPAAGQHAFTAETNQWGPAITTCGQWVYMVCGVTQYILQFKRDTATAKLTYVAATHFTRPTAVSDMVDAFFVRRNPGKGNMLYLVSGGDAGVYSYWYTIDDSTGALTQKGTSTLACHIGYQLLRSDSTIFYQMVDNNTIGWYGFDSIGNPVKKGQLAVGGMNYNYLVISKDMRSLYRQNGSGLLEIYKCDSATGAVALDTALNPTVIPAGAYGWYGLVDMSPDDRHLYLFDQDNNTSGTFYCILTRDLATGRLILPTKPKSTTMSYQAGPLWSQQFRFSYNADGKSGYYINLSNSHAPAYLGRFVRDSVTGAITAASYVAAPTVGAFRLFYDPSCRNLYTIGTKICAYKTTVVPSEIETALPQTIAPLSVGPNPCTGNAAIRFSCSGNASVKAAIYSTNGSLIRDLVNKSMAAGTHILLWSGRNESGSLLPSGVYVVRVTMGGQILNQSICLVR